ncbi:MAG: tripartite tricarboxylate transporter TctB family protein [Hyphomicrobiaceae bacterium]
MKRGWQAACACFFLIFAFAVYRSLSLPLGDALGPGPGFFPLCLAILGMTLCATLIVQVTASGGAEFAGPVLMPRGPALSRILAVIAGLAVAATLLETAGFRLVALVFCALLLPTLGARNPVVIAIFAVLGSFGVFHVFYHWLKVPLPLGNFGV